MSIRAQNPCEQAELLAAYAVSALSQSESQAMETHLAACAQCRADLEALTPLIESFAFWPTDVVRPSAALQARLADRLAAETGERVMPSGPQWSEPPWENVAPGIWVKLLANDSDRDVVSMLVRLEPGAEYPPHTHAGTEELYLLDGELWINERKLYPGDYSHAVAGTGDKRVWSETGCTCVLMTSTRDRLA